MKVRKIMVSKVESSGRSWKLITGGRKMEDMGCGRV